MVEFIVTTVFIAPIVAGMVIFDYYLIKAYKEVKELEQGK